MDDMFFFKGKKLNIRLEKTFDISRNIFDSHMNSHVFSRTIDSEDFDDFENNGRKDGFSIESINNIIETIANSLKRDYMDATDDIFKNPFNDEYVYIPMVNSSGLDSLNSKIFIPKITNNRYYTDCLNTINSIKDLLEERNLGPRVFRWTYFITLSLDKNPIFYSTVNAMVTNRITPQDKKEIENVILRKEKQVYDINNYSHDIESIDLLKIIGVSMYNLFDVITANTENSTFINSRMPTSSSLKEILNGLLLKAIRNTRIQPAFDPLDFMLLINSYSNPQEMTLVSHPLPLFSKKLLNI